MVTELRCVHRDALYRNHYQWWCGECGAPGNNDEDIFNIRAHVPGDRVFPSSEDLEEV